MTARWKWAVATASATVTVAAATAGAGAQPAGGQTEARIPHNTTIAGFYVGGMTRAEASAVLERRLRKRGLRAFRIRAGGRSHALTATELRVDYPVDAALDAALARTPAEGGPDIPVPPTYSPKALSRAVMAIAMKEHRAPRNVRVVFRRSGPKKIRSREGRRVSRRALKERIEAALADVRRYRSFRATTETVEPRHRGLRDIRNRYPSVVVVDRAAFRATLWRRLERERSYRIAVGAAGYASPSGSFEVTSMQVNPSWSVPNSPWAGSLAGTVVPPGPSNPIKARWIGVTDGVGFHGTADIGSLGTRASHGCFRMSVPDVIHLYRQVKIGTPVHVF